ncbi:RNase P subunit p29-like protein [Cristinia sonorae]|uniref:RNase P subunit p29-like protein n=1 Tax=Cristinia sonorae TaxID=1940300 RepID=A0A8K0UM75_9AGAR|nr:RNase P subunit p29-like protein [Cristinia sonorae]
MSFYPRATELVDIYTDFRPSDRVRLNSQTPFTPKYVKDNVTRSSDPALLYASRVQGRQLLLGNPPRESRAKKERDLKKARKSSSKVGVVGGREAKTKSIWKLTTTKFDAFLPLHQLWLDYMSELLGLSCAPSSPDVPVNDSVMPSTAGMHSKLVKADMHGAILTVHQSKNPCLIGLSGIVLHETENSFKIVTKADKLKLIPKPHSIFVLAVPLFSTISQEREETAVASSSTSTQTLDSSQVKIVHNMPRIEFDLHGNQFCFRSADRASRKFKHKESIEL